MVLGAILTSINNSLTHSLPKILPSSQILFFKSIIGLMLICLWQKGALKQLLLTQYLKWHFLKGFSGAIGNAFWIAAVQILPLAESSALSLTSALMTTAGAYCFFSENPTRQLMIAIIIGFIGVLLILKPTTAIFSVYSVYPLLSALAFSASSLIVKKVSLRDSSRTTLAYLLLFMTLWSSIPAFYFFQSMSCLTVIKLCGIGLLYAMSQIALIEAYTYTQAGFLAPFKFARFPLAIFSGWLFFNEHFSWLTLIGGGIIIASYCYLGSTLNFQKNKNKPPNCLKEG